MIEALKKMNCHYKITNLIINLYKDLNISINLGPKKYVESSDCDHICIEGENISFSDNARNLGVYFDCTFSMEHHVKQLCKSLFF